jgi:hypothetical protein
MQQQPSSLDVAGQIDGLTAVLVLSDHNLCACGVSVEADTATRDKDGSIIGAAY